MTIFTLVKQYLVPVYKSEIVEAETLAAACTKAIESDSWRDAGIDYESARATYIVFGVRGAYHNAYDAPRHLAVAIPPAFSEATAELSQTQQATIRSLLNHRLSAISHCLEANGKAYR